MVTTNFSIFAFLSASIVLLFISIASGEIQHGGGDNINMDGSVSCSWSGWTLGSCSVPCGAGKQMRTRTCICSSSNMMPNCKGSHSEFFECNSGPCNSCTWTDWTEWSDCLEGFQTRQKNCTCQGSNGDSNSGHGKRSGVTGESGTRVTVVNEFGDNCVEPSNCEGEQPIEKKPCPETNTKCYWSDWSEFSSCSRNCDDGQKTRTRQCICPGSSDDKTKGDSIDGSYSGSGCDSTGDLSSPSPCNCDGSTFESVPCNSFPCCSWGDFTEWSPCNQSCGGFSRRFAVCTCMPRYPTTPSDDCNSDSNNQSGNFDDDCTQTESSDGSNSLPTDCGKKTNQDDCSDYESTGSDSTNCNGGNDDNKHSSSSSEDSKGGKPSFASDFNDFSQCLGLQPYEEKECDSTTCGQQECEWNMWSEWTQCDKFCNGTQFRRQLCICGDDLGCSQNYSDKLCAGVPETEIRSCNVDSCCTWNFTDNWSECLTDNHCCGNGTEWRRQVCLCNGEESDDVFGCLLSGQLPLTETRECLMSDCCQFAPANPISCDQLMKSNNQRSDLCITTWKQRDCLCPSGIDGELEPGNFTQCAWDNTFFDNPPISFDRFQDFCLSPDQPDGTVDCNEFLSNGTCAAYTFEIGAGVVSSVSDISEGDCNYSDANCWDGWSVWSPCCGTCDEAYQWRIQTTSAGLSSCRQPPQFEFQNCTIENCCFWTYDDTVEWSSCSALFGDGFQSRFPYNCSCDDLTLCPVPPDYELQSCFTESESNCSWTNFFEVTSCSDETDSDQQVWYSQQCSCASELDTMSSSCDITNCFGTPNMTSLNCTSEENPSYGPCEWIEVSDCGECTYRLEEYKEVVDDRGKNSKKRHHETGDMKNDVVDNGDSGNVNTGKHHGNSGNGNSGNGNSGNGNSGNGNSGSDNGNSGNCNGDNCNSNGQSGNQQPGNQQTGNQQPDSGMPSDCGKSENGFPSDCDKQQPGNQQPENQQTGNQQPDSGMPSDCGKSENGFPSDCENQQPGNQQTGNQEPDSGMPSDCGKSENGFPSDCDKQQPGNNQPGNGMPSRPLKLIFTPRKQTITRICYCNGVPVDNSLCSPISLPLVETRDCTLDCKDTCTWTNLTDWTDCATLLNIPTDDSMDDSQTLGDTPLSQLLCLRRQCSCRKLTDNCDDTDMDSESSSLSDLTSPTWSEACRGYDILFMPLPETTQPEQETIQPEQETTLPEQETTQPEQINTTPVMALSSEEWKNCSCTWPLDTSDRTLPCCNLNWFELLNKQNPNDWESLAVEFITANLNLLNGVVPDDDSFFTDLNTTMDLLEICPGNWTLDDTNKAQQLKSRFQQWNQGGSWETDITGRIKRLRLSAGDEDSKSIITTTTGASKTSLLLVLIPTITVAILVFVGALIFINRPRQESRI